MYISGHILKITINHFVYLYYFKEKEIILKVMTRITCVTNIDIGSILHYLK